MMHISLPAQSNLLSKELSNHMLTENKAEADSCFKDFSKSQKTVSLSNVTAEMYYHSV